MHKNGESHPNLYGVPKAKKIKFLVCETTIISYLI